MGAENASGGSSMPEINDTEVNNHGVKIFPVVNIYSHFQITSEIIALKIGTLGNFPGTKLSTKDTRPKTTLHPYRQAIEPLKSYYLCFLFPLPPQLLQKLPNSYFLSPLILIYSTL